MQESKGVPPSIVANLSNEAILAALEESYVTAQPINEQLVDISLHIQTLTAEAYKRAIFRQLKPLTVQRTKTVLRISTKVSPKTGIPQLLQRLGDLKAQNIHIESVSYDESTGEFSFYAKPEFQFNAQVSNPSPSE